MGRLAIAFTICTFVLIVAVFRWERNTRTTRAEVHYPNDPTVGEGARNNGSPAGGNAIAMASGASASTAHASSLSSSRLPLDP